MGVSTDAILAYGYELPEFDPEELEWVEEDEDGYTDFHDSVEKRLRAAGVEGVSVTSHCSVDYPMYLLTTTERRSWRGSVGKVDAHEMVARPVSEGWDAKLDAAMKALGLTSPQERPSWLLVSDWG
ncbi:hypothetical protein [Streptomyces sp. MH60]|uniref:hypothetical protein n=1 Tax=Streptomyces sp. MH60 TaxID=1940758 RepID=UPI000CEDA361|nr:hypothetical protein [Streptomyces sp. MH60]PPS86442.1 hypothetical protein BZZ08_03409 [Streptomyces sp. MH60]